MNWSRKRELTGEGPALSPKPLEKDPIFESTFPPAPNGCRWPFRIDRACQSRAALTSHRTKRSSINGDTTPAGSFFAWAYSGGCRTGNKILRAYRSALTHRHIRTWAFRSCSKSEKSREHFGVMEST